MAVKDLRVMGRATQGVKLINIKEGDSIAAVAKVIHEDQDENQEINEDAENNLSSEEVNDVPLNNDVKFEITNEEEETED